MDMEDSGHSIEVLWTPRHVKIESNEKADVLAKLTCRFTTQLVIRSFIEHDSSFP